MIVNQSNTTPEKIAEGVIKLIKQVRHFDDETKILLISPIHLGENVWKSGFDPEFSKNSVNISKHLKEVYKDISLKRSDPLL